MKKFLFLVLLIFIILISGVYIIPYNISIILYKEGKETVINDMTILNKNTYLEKIQNQYLPDSIKILKCNF